MFDTQGASLRAGGNIPVSVFVKLDASNDETVLVAGANEQTYGISQVGTKYAPGIGANAYAAESGDNVQVFGPGSICMLTLGGSVTRGDFVKSGAAGVGITAATTGTTYQKIGAVALESGASGEKIRVQVILVPAIVPALS